MGKYFKLEFIEIKKPTNEKEAEEAIAELLNLADNGETEAETIADEFKIKFSTGDYGSGRTYYPPGSLSKSSWSSDYYYGSYDEDGMNTDGYWVSSSDQC